MVTESVVKKTGDKIVVSPVEFLTFAEGNINPSFEKKGRIKCMRCVYNSFFSRSVIFTMSVMRTPNLSSITTTSPFAISSLST